MMVHHPNPSHLYSRKDQEAGMFCIASFPTHCHKQHGTREGEWQTRQKNSCTSKVVTATITTSLKEEEIIQKKKHTRDKIFLWHTNLNNWTRQTHNVLLEVLKLNGWSSFHRSINYKNLHVALEQEQSRTCLFFFLKLIFFLWNTRLR